MPADWSAPNYQLIVPQKVLFGWGRRRELPAVLGDLPGEVWLLSGSRTLERTGVVEELAAAVRAGGREVTLFPVPSGEPTVAQVDELTDTLRSRGTTEAVVVAVGGGSTLDLAKAVAALVTQPRRLGVLDYLEGVGTGARLTAAPLPLVALPTTAGTGAEATRNAVISSSDPPFKKSLRADGMMPRVALIDPELTASVPRDTTVHSGLDAVTQLVESYISSRHAPVPRALVRQALPAALAALPVVVERPDDRAAREALAHAAFLSGIALANSGLGLAHGVAAGLGACHGVAHGLACAVMLPVALRTNRDARQGDLADLERLCDPAASPEDATAADAFIARITALCEQLGIPATLRPFGVTADHIPALVEASQGNSLSGNPRPVDRDELTAILSSLCASRKGTRLS